MSYRHLLGFFGAVFISAILISCGNSQVGSGFTAAENLPPIVSAGTDDITGVGLTFSLAGSVEDTTLPNDVLNIS